MYPNKQQRMVDPCEQTATTLQPVQELSVRLTSMPSMWNAIEFIRNVQSGSALQALILLDDSIIDPDYVNCNRSGSLYSQLKACHQVQCQMRTRGEDSRLLEELFKLCELKALKIDTIRFEIYDHPPHVQHFFEDYDAPDPTDDDGAFTVVLGAIAECDSFAEAFKMHVDDEQAIPVAFYGHRRYKSRECQKAFGQFKFLDLALQVSASGESNDGEDAEAFLAAIPVEKIRSLKILPAPDQSQNEIVMSAVLQQTCPNMESLEMCEVGKGLTALGSGHERDSVGMDD